MTDTVSVLVNDCLQLSHILLDWIFVGFKNKNKPNQNKQKIKTRCKNKLDSQSFVKF